MNSPRERLAQILKDALKDAPPEELKKNARAAAAAILARLNVADREEFDFRCEMLEQTAARLRELEERIVHLEKSGKTAKADKTAKAEKSEKTAAPAGRKTTKTGAKETKSQK